MTEKIFVAWDTGKTHALTEELRLHLRYALDSWMSQLHDYGIPENEILEEDRIAATDEDGEESRMSVKSKSAYDACNLLLADLGGPVEAGGL